MGMEERGRARTIPTINAAAKTTIIRYDETEAANQSTDSHPEDRALPARPDPVLRQQQPSPRRKQSEGLEGKWTRISTFDFGQLISQYVMRRKEGQSHFWAATATNPLLRNANFSGLSSLIFEIKFSNEI